VAVSGPTPAFDLDCWLLSSESFGLRELEMASNHVFLTARILIGLGLTVLLGCVPIITAPDANTTVANPVHATVVLQHYCGQFIMQLDGNNVVPYIRSIDAAQPGTPQGATPTITVLLPPIAYGEPPPPHSSMNRCMHWLESNDAFLKIASTIAAPVGIWF
jgi:hypothetical protein